MRRADRLYRIIETLRGRRRAVTAQQIAEAMEVSVTVIWPSGSLAFRPVYRREGAVLPLLTL